MKQKFNLRSIKGKMICYISVLVLVVCGGLGVISYNVASSALHDSATESLTKIAEQASNTIAQKVQGRFNLMTGLTKNPLFDDLSINNQDRIYGYLTGMRIRAV